MFLREPRSGYNNLKMREDMTKEEQIEIMKDNILVFMKNEMLKVLSDQETANALHYLEKVDFLFSDCVEDEAGEYVAFAQ